jgi:hypothetical protein
MPAGQEASARSFYCGVLGLTEEQKPENLAARGGAWFRGGTLRLHLGVDSIRPGRHTRHCSSEGSQNWWHVAKLLGFPPCRTNRLRDSIGSTCKIHSAIELNFWKHVDIQPGRTRHNIQMDPTRLTVVPTCRRGTRLIWHVRRTSGQQILGDSRSGCAYLNR